MEEEPGGVLAGAFNRYKAWPKWARIGAPVVAAILMVGAFGGGEDDPQPVQAVGSLEAVGSPEPELVTTTTKVQEVDVADLITDVPDGFRKGQVVTIIETACELMANEDTETVATDTAAAIKAANDSPTPAQFSAVLSTVEDLAPVACPLGVESHPDLMVGLVALTPSTTTTTTTTTTTITVPPTTAPPPPPPPPTTQAPAPAPSTHYKNCSEAHAAGVTPLYRGDPGYASHLDGDDDGVACEK